MVTLHIDSHMYIYIYLYICFMLVVLCSIYNKFKFRELEGHSNDEDHMAVGPFFFGG